MKVGNTSENLVNEICQIILFASSKKNNNNIYNNIMNLIKLKNKDTTGFEIQPSSAQVCLNSR